MHHPTDRIIHTTAFVTPVVEHWLERVKIEARPYSYIISLVLLTSIDIILCSPSILFYFYWKAGSDSCGSDHFLVIFENDRPLSDMEFDEGKLGTISSSTLH